MPGESFLDAKAVAAGFLSIFILCSSSNRASKKLVESEGPMPVLGRIPWCRSAGFEGGPSMGTGMRVIVNRALGVLEFVSDGF